MKALTGIALLVVSVVLQAQKPYRSQIYVGFTYSNVDLGPQVAVYSPSTQNYYGFEFDYLFNVTRHVGALAILSGGFGGTTTAPSTPYYKLDLTTTEVLVGPQFTWRKGKAVFFSNVLVGDTDTTLEGITYYGYSDAELIADHSLTLGVGGGLDLTSDSRLNLRAFQFEYLPTHRNSVWTSSYSATTGFVYHF